METKLFDIPKDTKLKVSQDVVDGKINFSFEFVSTTETETETFKPGDILTSKHSGVIVIFKEFADTPGYFHSYYNNQGYLDGFWAIDLFRKSNEEEIQRMNDDLNKINLYWDEEKFELVMFGVSKGDYVYAKAIDPDVTDEADCIYIVGDNDRVSSAFINLYKNKLYLDIESFHEEDYDIRYATQDEIDLLNNRLSDEGMYLDKETKTVKMYDNFECGDLVIAWNYEHLAIVGTLDDVDYSKEYRYVVGELGYKNAIQFNSIEQFKNKIK